MAGWSGVKKTVNVWVVLGGLALGSVARGQDAGPKLDGAAGTAVLTPKQKKLLEDSEKLVTMAAELKVSVDKSNKNELSLDVVRKAEALEKLARSVKERIREAR